MTSLLMPEMLSLLVENVMGLKAAHRYNCYHGDQPFLVVLAPNDDSAHGIKAILIERGLRIHVGNNRHVYGTQR